MSTRGNGLPRRRRRAAWMVSHSVRAILPTRPERSNQFDREFFAEPEHIGKCPTGVSAADTGAIIQCAEAVNIVRSLLNLRRDHASCAERSK